MRTRRRGLSPTFRGREGRGSIRCVCVCVCVCVCRERQGGFRNARMRTGGGEGEERLMPLFPVVHILGLLHGRRRRRREKNLAVLDTRARRVVGALHRERAPRARFIPLPCRARARARTLLLDDRIPRRSLLMGPVGAPEIPTRTGHNARLKVGFTTDRPGPGRVEPRSAGSYRDLAGSSSSSRLSPRPHPFFAPFHLLSLPYRAARISSSPRLLRSVLLSSFVLVLHPGPPPLAPRSWPFSFSLPPLF